ncbi:unnamed protein product [Prunus armeniaca]|uniref:Uncharacterized protein n=1 Tax=Prunus armeniaca TaxID=36596 RepID=A0A6J5Y1Y7_PRUAR|nr:unnamed protein product [Prunus armeniaca]
MKMSRNALRTTRARADPAKVSERERDRPTAKLSWPSQVVRREGNKTWHTCGGQRAVRCRFGGDQCPCIFVFQESE